MDAPAETLPQELLYDCRGGIAHLTFNRPEARNALTYAMYDRLAELCQATEGDRSIKAMIVSGAGDKAFAAGTDISQFRSVKTAEDAIAYEERLERVVAAVERCRVPTIAAIAGACTGGGAAIAAACDIRIAAPNARFGFPIARTLGNCLSIANLARLQALVGPARVKDLIFTARLADANEMLAAGLLSEIVPDTAALLPRAEAIAETIAENAPLTLSATKEGLARLQARLEPGLDRDLIVKCYTSRDFREGLEAFLAKRKPDWRGE
jgi:enoyl-CoA hydratase